MLRACAALLLSLVGVSPVTVKQLLPFVRAPSPAAGLPPFTPPFPGRPRRPAPLPARPRDGGLALDDDWATVNVINFHRRAYAQLAFPTPQLQRTWTAWKALYCPILDSLSESTAGWQWERADAAVERLLLYRARISAVRRTLAAYIDAHARAAHRLRASAYRNSPWEAPEGPPLTLQVVLAGPHVGGACDVALGSYSACEWREESAGMLDMLVPAPPSEACPACAGYGLPYPAWTAHVMAVESSPAALPRLRAWLKDVMTGAVGFGVGQAGQPGGRNLTSEQRATPGAVGPPLTHDVIASALCGAGWSPVLLTPLPSVAAAINAEPWAEGMVDAAFLLNPAGSPIAFGREVDPATRRPGRSAMPTTKAVPTILRELRESGEDVTTARPPRGDWPAGMTVPVDLTGGLPPDDPSRMAFGSLLRRIQYDLSNMAVVEGSIPSTELLASGLPTSSTPITCTSIAALAARAEAAETSRPRHGRTSRGGGTGRWADVLVLAEAGASADAIDGVLALAHANAREAEVAGRVHGSRVEPADVARTAPFLLLFDGPLDVDGVARDRPGSVSRAQLKRLEVEAGYACAAVEAELVACTLPVLASVSARD